MKTAIFNAKGKKKNPWFHYTRSIQSRNKTAYSNMSLGCTKDMLK